MMANYMPKDDALEDIDLGAWPERERRYLIDSMPNEVDEHIFDSDDEDDDGSDCLEELAMTTNDIADPDRSPIILYTDSDVSAFPPFQVALRKTVEFFEAKEEDLRVHNPSRKMPLSLGQVGLRCHACAQLPSNNRSPAATVFPTTLDEIHQSAQNLAANHIIPSCPCLSINVRNELLQQLARCKEIVRPMDKALWAQKSRDVGVIQDQQGLRFAPREGDIPPVDMDPMDFWDD